MLLPGIGHGHPFELLILQFSLFQDLIFVLREIYIQCTYVYFSYFYICSFQIQNLYEFAGVFFFLSEYLLSVDISFVKDN